MADEQADPKVKEGARKIAGEGLRFLFGADPDRVKIADDGLSVEAAPETAAGAGGG